MPCKVGCPKLDEINNTKTGIPYLNFFYIWVVCLCSSKVAFNIPFGLSTTYWMAFVTRGLLGLLCGILGPIKPAKKYPNVFSPESLFGSFPYFLPCFGISVLAAGACVACLRLPIFSLWAVSSRKYRGLSFTSQDVGVVLAISGIFMYQLLVKYAGSMKPFRLAAVLSIITLATYPFMKNLYGMELKALINIASLLKNIFAGQEQRGVANGIFVTLMSMFKAIGPEAAGIL
ncbi:hypothetical protein QYE76_025530 [Lolium multiflorum]|uniref:Uncharacterized protein n=1 Tax=Lolium multiflorum TaxID=4521 RepID=A0AAD8VX44_LOLMU|nr:hypothetical protein QYE76_025530 [Lolium multiflorum]